MVSLAQHYGAVEPLEVAGDSPVPAQPRRSLRHVGALLAGLLVALSTLALPRRESIVARPEQSFAAREPGQGGGSGDSFWQPERLEARDGKLAVRLVVREGLVAFEGGPSFVARTFNGEMPGPTLVVRRGDVMTLRLVNRLGYEDAEAPSTINTLRRPNTTVLHTHGFHVSPVRADNVFQLVRPQQTLDFVYEIPHNHPQGTFYLHPHVHGSSALQTAYAMVAAIVVASDAPPPLAVTADWVLLVGFVDLGSGKRTDVLEDSRLAGSTMPVQASTDSSTESFLIVNGQRNPTMTVTTRKVYRWRVVNTVIDGVLRILVGEQCQVAEAAADGVPFAKPRLRSAKHGVVIPPGSRRDLLVQCEANAQVRTDLDAVNGTAYDKRLAAYLGAGTRVMSGNLVDLRTSGGDASAASPSASPAESAERVVLSEEPGYTPEPRDLREAAPAVRQVLEWTQAGPDTPPLNHDGESYSFLGVNGEQYSDRIAIRVRLDDVVEWTIQNEWCLDGSPATESHPFHLHTNHFQVVDVSSRATGSSFSPDFAVGDFRDTITVPAPGNVTVRWVPRDFVGETLLHCHTLVHEDTGMMLNLEIVDSDDLS